MVFSALGPSVNFQWSKKCRALEEKHIVVNAAAAVAVLLAVSAWQRDHCIKDKWHCCHAVAAKKKIGNLDCPVVLSEMKPVVLNINYICPVYKHSYNLTLPSAPTITLDHFKLFWM